jgi:pilus assembly protein CpaF
MNDAVFEQLRNRLIERIDLTRNLTDEEILIQIHELVRQYARQYRLSLEQCSVLARRLFNSVRRLDVLQELLEDDSISEIMVNGADTIFVERAGKLYRTPLHFQSAEKLTEVIQQIVSRTNRMVNEANPIVDTRLEDGSRVNVIMPPVALNGPIVTIRRFPKDAYTMERMVENNTLSEEVAHFLETLVRARYNLFFSGGTGSGKTTMLNALSQFIPHTERIVTIEDSAELQLLEVDNIIRLEVKNETSEGEGAVTIRDLIRASLRVRPDRIIVGEVRGGECLDMLQALNCGHAGSLSTGHGNSCEDMLKRLETMVLMGCEMPLEAIRGQIASGIDILVHLSRMRDRTRKLISVTELVGYENGKYMLNELFRFQENGMCDGKVYGEWVRCGTLSDRQKLETAGIKEEAK